MARALQKWERPPRDYKKYYRRFKKGFRAGAPYLIPGAVIGAGWYAYEKSLTPEERREAERERRKLEREMERSEFYQVTDKGINTYLNLAIGIPLGYTAYQTYKARKTKGQKGMSSYWKKNPEAYRYYKHKKAKGDTKAVNTLLKRIKQAPAPKANYFKTLWKSTKLAGSELRDFNKPRTREETIKRFKKINKMFRPDEKEFMQKFVHFSGSKKYRRVLLAGGLAGGIYGYHKAKKAQKKKRRK